MVLGFQERFVQQIESGDKRHSIRLGKRWRPGMIAHLYRFVRTKKQKLIFMAQVHAVDDIKIRVEKDAMYIRINGRFTLGDDEAEELAKRDGFPLGAAEMHAFWLVNHGVGIFEGQIVYWLYSERKSAA